MDLLDGALSTHEEATRTRRVYTEAHQMLETAKVPVLHERAINARGHRDIVISHGQELMRAIMRGIDVDDPELPNSAHATAPSDPCATSRKWIRRACADVRTSASCVVPQAI